MLFLGVKVEELERVFLAFLFCEGVWKKENLICSLNEKERKKILECIDPS